MLFPEIEPNWEYLIELSGTGYISETKKLVPNIVSKFRTVGLPIQAKPREPVRACGVVLLEKEKKRPAHNFQIPARVASAHGAEDCLSAGV